MWQTRNHKFSKSFTFDIGVTTSNFKHNFCCFFTGEGFHQRPIALLVSFSLNLEQQCRFNSPAQDIKTYVRFSGQGEEVNIGGNLYVVK